MQREKHFPDGAVCRNRVAKIVHKWRHSFLFLCVELPFKTTHIALSAHVLHYFLLVQNGKKQKTMWYNNYHIQFIYTINTIFY